MKIAIINDTRPTHHYGCRLVMENLMNLLHQEQVEVVWTWPVSTDWRKHRSQIKSMPEVDAFIINGEGTIHHSDERKYAQALIDFAEFSTTELKKPCYLINATLHKNSADAYRRMAFFRAIFVRDRGSLDELNEAGLQGQYVPDLTFAKNHKYTGGATAGTCVIDSTIRGDSQKLQDFAAERGFPFRSMVVARPSNAKFLRSPRPWVKNVIRWLKTDRHISIDPVDYILYLRQFDLVITGRYHTVTMCIKNEIPFIALESNTPKIRYLLSDAINSDKRSMGFQELESADLNAYGAFSDDDLERVRAFSKTAELKLESMIAAIVSDAGSNRENAFAYPEIP